MARFEQAVLIASTILGSWLAMQAVHESGHVLGARFTGARVTQVVLHPLEISRTEVDDGLNPQPLVVVWAGPIVGVLAPLALWGVAARVRFAGAFVLRFFAGFCLVANGLYLSVGSFGRVGDCGELLAHGAHLGQLWLFGALTVPLGLWLWHGQGKHFGLGPAPQPLRPAVSYGALATCVLLVTLGLVVGR